MDEFGDLTERYGLKQQGKSAPMASSRRLSRPSSVRNNNSGFNSNLNSKSAYNSSSGDGSFFNNDDIVFASNRKAQNGLDDLNDEFDIFGGFGSNLAQNGNVFSSKHDPFFPNSNYSSAKSSFDGDILSGLNSSNSNHNNNTDDFFGSFVSKPNQSAQVDDLLGDFNATLKPPSQDGSVGVDDLIPGFGNGSTNSSNRRNNSTYSPTDDPFIVLESTSTTTNSTSADLLEEFSEFSHSGSTKYTGVSNAASPLKPPPKPGQLLKNDKVKSSNGSIIDELEEFGKVKVRNNENGGSDYCTKETRARQAAKEKRYKEAEYATQKNQQMDEYDVASFFGVGARSSSAPRSRATSSGTVFDTKINTRGGPAVDQKKSNNTSSGVKKASLTTSIFDDFTSLFGDAPSYGEFEEVEGESDERRRARLNRHQRTKDRMAQAVMDMNQRDLQSQYEQEERHRVADRVNTSIKRWAEGREGNMRALLSTLQDVLWPGCGWEPVSLADLITSTAVKKAYRKANLCVHPDKVQQKGATLEQRYAAEKVFDILKESWTRFEKAELS